ncbi:MAG: crossover junction endodeoxyribonuclease RuvC [Brevinematia bacterium]
MKILGIDPGYSIMGFGVVEEHQQGFKLLKAGVIETSNQTDFNEKILSIPSLMSSIIEEYRPDLACVEEVFFNKNVKTAMKVAQIIGIVKIEILKRGIKLITMTPLEVKKYITGTRGKHPKMQIQNLVKMILNLNEIPKPDDCADAIAIAIAGALKSNQLKL